MNVALIACSNGLGHVRRCLVLSRELIRNNANVTLFAPIKSVNKLTESIEEKRLSIIDFCTDTSIENLLDYNSTSWIKKLPNLSQYDIVVSDNLPEILYLRADAWISGSFLWHESLINFPKEEKQRINHLIKDSKARLISSEILTPSYMHQFENLHKVGLYSGSLRSKNCSPVAKKDLLISIGLGGNLEFEIKKFIEKISISKVVPYDTIWIEPRICPSNRPDWIKPATYSRNMYLSIVSAIIRPGVGTISDCLYNYCKVFMFYEKGNMEMNSNANLLHKLELGETCKSFQDAWDKSLAYSSNKKMINHFENLAAEINFDGAQESVKILLGHY